MTDAHPLDAPSTPHAAEDEPALYTVDNWSIDESLGYLLSAVKAQMTTAIDAELAPLDITRNNFV